MARGWRPSYGGCYPEVVWRKQDDGCHCHGMQESATQPCANKSVDSYWLLADRSRSGDASQWRDEGNVKREPASGPGLDELRGLGSPVTSDGPV